tara:strand:- start:146 stop:313 length:168 start_codon:yes stop_codon:yes gene_type:complete
MKLRILLITLCSLGYLGVFAQSAPPGTPIDGGLSLLLAGGAAYGIKKIRDHRSDK